MSWERARLQQASPLHHQESDDDQVAPDIAILAAVPTGLEPATFADHTSAVAIPAVDVDASSQRRADAEAFVAELFPDGVTGKMIAAIGGPPSWDTSTGYDTKKGWREQICDFPADRDAVIDALLAHSDTRDAYLCTGLAYLNRGDGSLKEIWAIHADWDGKPEDTDECLARVEKFGGFAINSGTTGHLQCFIPLREPIVRSGAKQTSPPGTFTWWCEAFHAYLPPGSEKKIWNDILRVPGTFNHKSAVRPGDTGRPTPVTWALRPSGERRDLAELAEQLGLSQAAVAEKPVAGPQEPRTYTNAAGPMESGRPGRAPAREGRVGQFDLQVRRRDRRPLRDLLQHRCHMLR